MERKLIFFDIDGTLLGKKGVAESTKRAIRLARQNGHICMINTGRTQKLLGPKIRSQVEFDGYVIGCGTALEYHGEELFHHGISAEDALVIIESVRRNRIDTLLEGPENNFHEPIEKIYTDRFRKFMLDAEKEGLGYGSFEESVGRFDKLYCYCEDMERWEKFKAEFQDKLVFIDRENQFFEVVQKEYSKATGMREVAKLLGIPMENTVAVGDSMNDMEMLQCAHTAIVMGNAVEGLREIADFVTTDVDDDGIENAMKWLGVI